MESTPATRDIDPRLHDIDLLAPGAAARVYRIALDLDADLSASRHTPECDLIHDREFLDANTTWAAVYGDPSMPAEEKADTIDRCCETLDDRVTAHGSHDLPRPLLAFCVNRDCFAWERP